MNSWPRRIGNTVLRALTWAVVWAPIAVLVGLIVDPNDSMDEMWMAIGAYPGFLCAVVFSVVLGIAERHRNFEELSLVRVAVWGAVSGLLVGLFPFAAGSANTALPLWLWGGAIIGSLALLSSASAVGTALRARMKKRALQDAN